MSVLGAKTTVGQQGVARRSQEWHESGFEVLGLADVENAVFEINILQVKAEGFSAAQAGDLEQSDQGSVSVRPQGAGGW